MLVKFFQGLQELIEDLLRHVPTGFGEKLRYYYYRSRCGSFGKEISIPTGCRIVGRNINLGDFVGLGFNTQLYAGGNNNEVIIIGSRVFLNSNVMINADHGGRIEMGSNILIGPNVVIRASNHEFHNRDIPILSQGHTGGKIVIDDDVWIGANVVILPDVRIGKGAIIGAGAVVTNDISSYSIATGVPAKETGKR